MNIHLLANDEWQARRVLQDLVGPVHDTEFQGGPRYYALEEIPKDSPRAKDFRWWIVSRTPEELHAS